MPRPIARRLSFANVVSLLALFVALERKLLRRHEGRRIAMTA